jgi:ABC-type antimicrobial peptide transport system permease subunit
LNDCFIELLLLAGLGGVIGVRVEVGLSVLGATSAPSFGPAFATFALSVTIPTVVLLFAISLAIGLVAGGCPANRTAWLSADRGVLVLVVTKLSWPLREGA